MLLLSNSQKGRYTYFHMKIINNSKLVLLVLSIFITLPAWSSFLTLSESAELIPEGTYRLGVAPQLRLSDGNGFNAGFFIDGFLSPSMNWRGLIGGGTTDFFAQGSIKWVPIPDVDKQPAIGGRAMIFFARDNDLDHTGIQFAPILSKQVNTDHGLMTPYISLPISIIGNSKKTVTALQLAVGSELNLEKGRQIGAEFDLNLNDAVTSLTVFFAFPFDNSVGFKK